MRKTYWIALTSVVALALTAGFSDERRGFGRGYDTYPLEDSTVNLAGQFYTFSTRDSGRGCQNVVMRDQRGGETNLGGCVTSRPQAVAFYNDVYVIARGTDRAIHYRTVFSAPVAGDPWRSLGGVVQEVVDAKQAGNDIQIHVIGTDGAVWERMLFGSWRKAPALPASAYDAATTGGSTIQAGRQTLTFSLRENGRACYNAVMSDGRRETNLGGCLTTQPQAVEFMGDVHVFARGTDGAIHTRSVSNAPLTGDAWRTLGGGTLELITVGTTGAGDVRIYAIGTDNKIWERGLLDSIWRKSGGVPMASAPSRGSSTVDMGGSYLSFELRANGASCFNVIARDAGSGETNLGGCVTTQPIAVRFLNDVYVFARGTNGSLFYRGVYNSSVIGDAWRSLGGGITQVLSVTGDGSEVKIVVIGTDGQVWERSMLSYDWRRSSAPAPAPAPGPGRCPPQTVWDPSVGRCVSVVTPPAPRAWTCEVSNAAGTFRESNFDQRQATRAVLRTCAARSGGYPCAAKDVRCYQ